jgi:hypothetical protein
MATQAAILFYGEKRAEKRLVLSVPILLKFSDPSGKAFIEKTQTTVVNRAGAKVLTQQPVTLGTRLEVAIPNLKRGSWATVVWLGEKKNDKREVGIALDQTGDIWGVQFPGDNQQLTTREVAPLQEIAQISMPEQAVSSESGSQAPPPSLEVAPNSSDMLSGVLQKLTTKAIEECLGNALQELKQISDVMRRMQKDAAVQAEDRIGRAVETALEQLETRAVEVTGRHRQACEQSLHALGAAAEEHLNARATEYDARLAASAKKVRSELVRTLTDICNDLGRE